MQEATPQTTAATDDDDARLESLGYKPQLNRVLGLFSNFSVAFTYLSPIVGVFSLFTLGAGMAGPAYVWTTWIPVGAGNHSGLPGHGAPSGRRRATRSLRANSTECTGG